MNTFTANTVADATKVNANFNGLADGTEIEDDAIVTRHILDSNVTSPKLNATVAFRAYLASSLAIPTATQKTVVFDTEAFDIGSNYDTSTGNFTAPYDGLYFFTGRGEIQTLAVGNSHWLYIVVGSTIKARAFHKRDTSNYDRIDTISALLQLSANDTVHMAVYHNYGSNRNLIGAEAYSSFMGFMIGRT